MEATLGRARDAEGLGRWLGRRVASIEEIGDGTGFLSTVLLLVLEPLDSSSGSEDGSAVEGNVLPRSISRCVMKCSLGTESPYFAEAVGPFQAEVEFYSRIKACSSAQVATYMPVCYDARWNEENKEGVVLLSFVPGAKSITANSPEAPFGRLGEESMELLYGWLGALHSATGPPMAPERSIVGMMKLFLAPGKKYAVEIRKLVQNGMDLLSPAARSNLEEVLDNAVAVLEWCERTCSLAPPATYSHGDLWPNNVLVSEDGTLRAVIDFQFASSGESGLFDVVVVESMCLSPECRRRRWSELVRRYARARGLHEEEQIELVLCDHKNAAVFGCLFLLLSATTFPAGGEMQRRACEYINDSVESMMLWKNSE